MFKTNFDKVTEFNVAFDSVVNTTPQLDIFDKNPDLINLRLNLITEEYEELKEAIKNKDIVETVDALCDILYVTEGFFNAIGINGNQAFDLVHQSNMSKLCNSEEEAILSVEGYLLEGRYKDPAYKLSKSGTYWIVYDRATNKILKNKNYSAVDLKSFIF